MSHTSCVVYAIIMASFSTGLHYAGISMGYLYLLVSILLFVPPLPQQPLTQTSQMGVIISGAVLPASLTLISTRQSWAAATFTPPLALCCSLIAWLVTAKKQGGDLTVLTTGANNPMLAGNVVSLLAPLIFIPILSLIFRSPKYDWRSMAAMPRRSS